MAEVTPSAPTQEEMFRWYELQQKLATLKQEEHFMRLRLFKHYFPAPVEGTNTFALDDGYELKGKHVIDRKVDKAALTTLTPKLIELGVSVDGLIKRDPELITSAYRPLQKDTSELGKKKLNLFDQCLIIKPGSPQLEVVLPAKNKLKE